MRNDINVYSEIGILKKVLVHPGYELEKLSPKFSDKLLFEDIPYMEVAREEHDMFTKN
ncbi:hypothetical protein [Clostridium frigidicarnis]|uniref:Amidinotransferase n=1 Tax=Clostridium frigidicarnis TaxID=84698 RepID=A0A1I1B5R9_9CLOT|nr:hypothetical protein [Clostridium frigidicarnis]SFB45407.1 Amidinotransferase [Clostridium frigidicarnis]